MLGAEVKIGSFVIPGAGEYDIASIQCEARFLDKGLVYVIRAEDLNITFLAAVTQEVTKLDDASNTDILIIDLRSDDKPEEVRSILKALEPAYLLLIGPGVSEDFLHLLNQPAAPSSTLKVVRGSLPLEGTLLIPAA